MIVSSSVVYITIDFHLFLMEHFTAELLKIHTHTHISQRRTVFLHFDLLLQTVHISRSQYELPSQFRSVQDGNSAFVPSPSPHPNGLIPTPKRLHPHTQTASSPHTNSPITTHKQPRQHTRTAPSPHADGPITTPRRPHHHTQTAHLLIASHQTTTPT